MSGTEKQNMSSPDTYTFSDHFLFKFALYYNMKSIYITEIILPAITLMYFSLSTQIGNAKGSILRFY